MNKEVSKALIKRFISSVITLFFLVSFLFIITRLSPGDPTQKFISAEFSPDLAKKISESFNLNKPITEQYFSFVGNLFKGDLGTSYNYHLPVLSVIWQFLQFTLIFAAISFIIQIASSLFLAIWVVKKKNHVLDKTISGISLVVYSTPAFVLGVLLIYFFSVQLNLFPISGLESLDSDSLSFTSRLIDKVHHLILPLVTLSLAGIALFYKYLKENLEEVYHQTYILQLRANGNSESEILRKHVIPNAVRPLISVAGIELGILFGGALITEVIFSLPGMGRLTIDSILARDYPLIIGCSFVAGALMIITNFVADLVKIKIDKRMIKELIN
jgi:peptide/nickel transport system permease protein